MFTLGARRLLGYGYLFIVCSLWCIPAVSGQICVYDQLLKDPSQLAKESMDLVDGAIERLSDPRKKLIIQKNVIGSEGKKASIGDLAVELDLTATQVRGIKYEALRQLKFSQSLGFIPAKLRDEVGEVGGELTLHEAIHRSLAKLDDKLRIVIEGLYGFGPEKTAQELADELGVTTSTIYQRKQSALNRLRNEKLLEPFRPEVRSEPGDITKRHYLGLIDHDRLSPGFTVVDATGVTHTNIQSPSLLLSRLGISHPFELVAGKRGEDFRDYIRTDTQYRVFRDRWEFDTHGRATKLVVRPNAWPEPLEMVQTVYAQGGTFRFRLAPEVDIQISKDQGQWFDPAIKSLDKEGYLQSEPVLLLGDVIDIQGEGHVVQVTRELGRHSTDPRTGFGVVYVQKVLDTYTFHPDSGRIVSISIETHPEQ